MLYQLTNPNSVGIKLGDVEYAFSVEGKSVAAGHPPQGLTIPASGQTIITLPATVKFSDLGEVAQVLLTQDFAHYRAEGQVGVQTPVGTVHLPFSKQGQFEVPKIPTFQIGAPRVTQLDFQGATVNVPLTVLNRNSYTLPLNGIVGLFRVGGADVASMALRDLPAFAGRESRSLSVPVTVKFSGLAALNSALKLGETEVGFQGQVSSGGVSLPLSFNQKVSVRK